MIAELLKNAKIGNSINSNFLYFIKKKKKNIFSGKKLGTAHVRVGAGSGAVIRIYGTLEPEPKEIFTAPQHCE